MPSLYVGGLTLLLALSAVGFRDGPPWRGWLTAIALGTALGSFGKYGSPLWWARFIPGWEAVLGAHDPAIFQIFRTDGGVSDGDGSVYWFMATILPGFGVFRYPGKLLTSTSLALSALAGLGWDGWQQGRTARGLRTAAALVALSLAGLATCFASHAAILTLLRTAASKTPPNFLGPLDPSSAVMDLKRALFQGAVVMGAAFVVAIGARHRRPWAGLAAPGSPWPATWLPPARPWSSPRHRPSSTRNPGWCD